MLKPLSGPFVIPETQTPAGALFLLHGFGSDGQDLFSLSPYLDAALPAEHQRKLAYFSPNGPQPTPFAMGYQWFSDKNWTFNDRPGIDAAAAALRAYIEAEAITKLGLSWRQIFVLGFSQGGMVALHAVPLWEEELGGVIGHSTQLKWPDALPETPTQTPVLLLHGTADDVVPADALVASAQTLGNAGLTVQHQLLPGLAHGLNEDSIRLIAAFMAERLA